MKIPLLVAFAALGIFVATRLMDFVFFVTVPAIRDTPYYWVVCVSAGFALVWCLDSFHSWLNRAKGSPNSRG